MRHTMTAMALATLLMGCSGSPLELASRKDLSTAETQDLCRAAGFAGANTPERLRLLREVNRRNEITEREIDAARQEKVFIGMSRIAALCSWGAPYAVNRTTHTFGVHEQWVYVSGLHNTPSNFLYFEDGRLKTIQN